MYTVSLKGNRNTKAEIWFKNRQVACYSRTIRDMIDGPLTRVYLIRKQTDDSLKFIYSGNLVYNSGFEEVVTPELASDHHLSFAVRDKADSGATFFSDLRQIAEGLISLRLVTSADRAGKKVLFFPVAVSKGTISRLSVRARSAQQIAMPCFRLTKFQMATCLRGSIPGCLRMKSLYNNYKSHLQSLCLLFLESI